MYESSDQSFFQRLKGKLAGFKASAPLPYKIIKITLGLFALGFFLLFLLFLFVWLGAFGELPNTDDIKNVHNNVASEVYDEKGELLGKYFIQNRTVVDVEDISPNIINALVATEDARFFEHRGIDLRSFLRVVFKTILMRDRSSGGGSTLSQQLAKNLFPRQRHGVLSIPVNKIKEMFVARRLEKVYSKNELIAHYLNTVPFSGNIYGIEVAAKQFFNTNTKDIKVEQAAVLVGMLKATSTYNPVRNPKNSTRRRNTVLNQMYKYKYLTKEEYDELKELPLGVDYKRESHSEGLATYFREHLRHEVEDILSDYETEDGEKFNVYSDGLKIYTTINADMQRYAEDAVQKHLAGLQKDFDNHWKGGKPWGNDQYLINSMKRSKRYKIYKERGYGEAKIKSLFEEKVNMKIFTWEGEQKKNMSPMDSIKHYFTMLNAGFLVMDHHTGYIKAWVGGSNHKYFQYDHVKSKRQVGSTFKPVVYATALRNGRLPCDYINNRLVTYSQYDDWQPRNSDDHYFGVYSMAGGLRKSVNTIAVDLIMDVGVDSVVMMAEDFGIESEIPAVPAIALGTANISLMEMSKVYGTIANRGIRPEPRYLSKIETADGEVLYDIADLEEIAFLPIIDENQADMLVNMLEGVVDSGTAVRLRRVYNIKGDIAGKTGTTQSHADGWFMGFTPNLVTGVWVGGESPAVRFRDIRLGQGANMALPIAGRFLNSLYSDPKYASMAQDTFATPSEETLELLNCPFYLDSRPVEIDTTWYTDSNNPDQKSPQEKIDDILKKYKDRDRKPKMKTNPSRRAADLEKERDKIRKKNEKTVKKRERKKKRKKFWDKLFGKNKN